MVRSLSFHATYRCRHAGACCTSNWPIPVEADRLVRLHAAVASGRLRPANSRPAAQQPDDRWFVVSPAAPEETPAILATTNHRCVFFDESDGGGCLVHRALGHDALPLACRQFPRVVV